MQTVTYSAGKKYAYFDGLRYCMDEKTGYYLNSTNRKRLHRSVFEKAHGTIPKGYHVHHIDHDKGNNELENLELMEGRQHIKYHGELLTEEERKWKTDNMLSKAIPAAAEWHHSPAGKEWHKAHYESMKEALHARQKTECRNCGAIFDGPIGRTGFCSNKCKSAWRRKSGLDNEQRTCIVCGKEFTANRYRKTRCCSRSCANRVRGKGFQHYEAPTAAGL